MNQTLPPIAQTLSNLELVPHDHLVRITQNTKQSKEIIKELIEHEIISGLDLCVGLSNHFGTPYFDIEAFNLDLLPRDYIEPKLVERHFALPLYKHGNKLFVAIVDPTNKTALDEIKFYTGLQIHPIQVEPLALENVVQEFLTEDETSLEDFLGDGDIELDIADEDAEAADDTDFDPNDAPIVKYVNKILIDAINQGASDIHIEPFEKEVRVRYRVDGILHKVASQPLSLAGRMAARIKIISKLDIAERRTPQDGRVKLRISKTKAFDFRVSTLPTLYGEKVVMRLLDSSAANLDLAILGFTQEQLQAYTNIIKRPYGMVLITGPTGSGKTVTLYSALNMLNDPTKNICTVEDPVEIQLPGVTQVNINERANLTFASALRAFLRQDPDIIMLGEIRDLETAEIAIKASQTGHMVLSTLHTNDAPSTLTRLLNMGVPTFNVASAVHLIIAQRLMRKLCVQCKETVELPEKTLLDIGFHKEDLAELTIFQPSNKGCASCTQGYKGRAGIFQVMPVTEKIRTIILQGGNEQDIEKSALADGILDLRASGLLKVKEGVTSLEEIERVTNV